MFTTENLVRIRWIVLSAGEREKLHHYPFSAAGKHRLSAEYDGTSKRWLNNGSKRIWGRNRGGLSQLPMERTCGYRLVVPK